VFLDRDGVINRRPPEGLYITSPGELELLPDAVDAIARLNRHGFLVFVVTNQRCIARGIVPAEVIAQIHEHMLRSIAAGGGCVDRIYLCPHDYGDACQCRKPKPGMLRQASAEYALNLEACWMVGDNLSDVEAGRAAGCHTMFFGESTCALADCSVPNLAVAVTTILAQA
jgi:D-glycero-D-manno-heptose 1,7-bisphosphate phosphatase